MQTIPVGLLLSAITLIAAQAIIKEDKCSNYDDVLHARQMMKDLMQQQNEMKQKLNEQDGIILDQKRTIQKLQEEWKETQRNISDLSETVVFAAFISKTLEVDFNTFLNVVFDEVDFNAGNSYNASDGFFTAPSDGLFVFTWAFLVDTDKIFDSQIQMNLRNRGLSNCNNVGGKGLLPCSNTTPLLLKKGDRVNIKKRHGNKIFGDKWCSFKGWKVY